MLSGHGIPFGSDVQGLVTKVKERHVSFDVGIPCDALRKVSDAMRDVATCFWKEAGGTRGASLPVRGRQWVGSESRRRRQPSTRPVWLNRNRRIRSSDPIRIK